MQIALGTAYYPEQWPVDRWSTDVALMKSAGIKVVRLAEFAWARLERRGSKFTVDWLEQAVALLSQEGISIVLGTPTAAPPKWLWDEATSRGESIAQIDRNGRVRGFGSRRHYCVNSPYYRAATERIVEQLAKTFGRHPALIAWQVDNEFGGDGTTMCYCNHCRDAFRRWLRDRYISIDELNATWGTVFWSQEYDDFDSVEVPSLTAADSSSPDPHNPSLLIDYRRFTSDAITEYLDLQAAIIRRHSNAPITHNLMGHFGEVDYERLGVPLDFVSWDNYPVNQWQAQEPSDVAMAHDITFGVKGAAYWVTEQISGPCGWDTMGPTPVPGQLRLWDWQAVAHGANLVSHFRWRSALAGTEQNWTGVLDHDGRPRRRFREIAAVGQEFARLPEWAERTAPAGVALLRRDFENLWSQTIQHHAPGLDYEAQLLLYYNALWHLGISTHVGSAVRSTGEYALIVAPLFNLVDESELDEIRSFVQAGGTLVLTYRSGTRTRANTIRPLPPPGVFADLCGLEVEEFSVLSHTIRGASRAARVSLVDSGGPSRDTGLARFWVERVEATDPTVQVLATFTDGPYPGYPAVTRRPYGTGTVYYVACDLDSATTRQLIEEIAQIAGCRSLQTQFFLECPDEVEVALRVSDGKANDGGTESALLFVLNHSDHQVTCKLREPAFDVITGTTAAVFALEPYGVAVLTVFAGI